MRYLLLPLLFITFQGFSQKCKEYVIGIKGDTLNCVDYKGRKQGRWVVKVGALRGEPGYEEEGVFLNGKKEGVWRKFSVEGDLLAVENYRWGNKHGQNVYFTNYGDPIRAESWRAVNPDNPYDTVDVYDMHDPTKVVRKEIIKLEGFTLKHGTWKYYGPGGVIDRTENWYLDKPAVKEGDDLLPIDVTDTNAKPGTGKKSDSTTTAKKNLPKPKAVLDYEKKNAGKKKIKVRDGQTGGL